jgi:DNA-directed RNA polymerase subunit H (RpoH/RPB5)
MKPQLRRLLVMKTCYQMVEVRGFSLNTALEKEMAATKREVLDDDVWKLFSERVPSCIWSTPAVFSYCYGETEQKNADSKIVEREHTGAQCLVTDAPESKEESQTKEKKLQQKNRRRLHFVFVEKLLKDYLQPVLMPACKDDLMIQKQDQLVIIAQEGKKSINQTTLKNLRQKLTFEINIYLEDNLVRNPLQHDLVRQVQQKRIRLQDLPPHLRKKPQTLNPYRPNDPIVRFHGWITGDIIKILRFWGGVNEPEPFYRRVP